MTLLRIKRLEHCYDLPRYATPGAAGADIYAARNVLIVPRCIEAVSTGFCLEIPEGFEVQIRPRSGLVKKKYITVPNSPGTVDGDFRGEIQVLLYNFGNLPVKVERGERIAQMVLCPISRAMLDEVDELSETERGDGGFGSTGLRDGSA